MEEELKKMGLDSIKEFSFDGIKAFAKVVSLYDADTCNIIFYMQGFGYTKLNCRLSGIDSPEMKPSLKNLDRDNEKRAAIISRNKLLQLITKSEKIELEHKYSKNEVIDMLKHNTNLVYVHLHGFDKYGRILIEMYDGDNHNTSYNKGLLSGGFAGEYLGGSKKSYKEYFKY